MSTEKSITLTDPDMAEPGTRCTVEYELQTYASNKVGTDWVMTHKRFDVPKVHAEAPLYKDPALPVKEEHSRVEELRSIIERQNEERDSDQELITTLTNLNDRLQRERDEAVRQNEWWRNQSYAQAEGQQQAQDLAAKSEAGKSAVKDIEVSLFDDLIEYWGDCYYVVGDSCPPSRLHEDLAELRDKVLQYGSFSAYLDRPIENEIDPYTDVYCPDEPGNGC